MSLWTQCHRGQNDERMYDYITRTLRGLLDSLLQEGKTWVFPATTGISDALREGSDVPSGRRGSSSCTSLSVQKLCPPDYMSGALTNAPQLPMLRIKDEFSEILRKVRRRKISVKFSLCMS